MKKYQLLSILFLWLFTNALHAIDNSKLVSDGQKLLHRAMEHNRKAMRGKRFHQLRFVVPVEGNRYTSQKEVGKHGWFVNPGLLEGLETRLQETYRQSGVECYLLLINAFDVVVNATIPEGSTLEDLFINGKFFDEQSNIRRMQAEHDTITASIISKSILGNKRPAYIFSIGCYNVAYQKENGRDYYFYNFRRTDKTGQVAFFREIFDYTKVSLKNDPSFRFQENRDSLACIPITTLQRALINSQLKVRILSTFTPEGILNILESFTTSADYFTLNVSERLHILSVLASGDMDGSYSSPGEEGYALKVIAYTPKDDVKALLEGLENPSVLNNNSNYTGDKQNSDALIKRLVDEIDDGIVFGIGGNNYQKLIKNLSDLVLSSSDAAKHYSQVDENSVINRVFFWGYEETYAPIGTHKYDVDIGKDGKIICRKQVVDRWDYISTGTGSGTGSGAGDYQKITVHWDNSYPEYTLGPFELVLFVDKTGCSMVQEAGAIKNEPKVVPAIFLEYAKDKLNEENTFEAIALTIDALIIATGPGLFYKAAKSGRYAVAAFEACQFVSGTVNLTLNNIDDPDLKELALNFNKIMATWGVTRGLMGLKSFSPKFIQAAVNQELKQVPRETAEGFVLAFEKAKSKLGNLPAESQTQLNKLRKYFEGKGFGKTIIHVSDDIVRGVSKKDFMSSVKEFATNPTLAEEAYLLWKGEKWGELEKLFKKNKLNFDSRINNVWPPNRGFVDIEKTTLDIGEIFDRYGGNLQNGVFSDGGSFASPRSVDFGNRALPESYKTTSERRTYEVIKPIPEVKKGKSIPWFGQPGNGIQYELSDGIDNLIKYGYIKEIK